jgi:RimJ/RimL family protein N-acetyltransferase
MYTDHEIGAQEHKEWLERTIGRDDVEMFAVILVGAIVGAVGLTSIAPAQRRSDWVFYLSCSVRGEAFGATNDGLFALALLSALEFKFLNWAFGDKGLHKLNGEVLRFNEAVIALHKKFGFSEEGVRRDHIFRNGEWIDAVLLGMTEEEWSDRSAILRERLFK